MKRKLQTHSGYRIGSSGSLVVTWELLGVGGTGGRQRFFAKIAISITFLVNIPEYAFERIQGILELLAINAYTLIFRLCSPYIRGLETTKRSFPNKIGATWWFLTGPLSIVSVKVVFHQINYVLFIHTIMIDEIYNILCKQGC